MERCNSVIFDMDGVIADTDDLFLQATLLAAEEHGLDISASDFIRLTILAGESVFNESHDPVRKRRDAIYLDLLENVKYVPGCSKEDLQSLPRNIPVGLGTASRKIYADRVLERLGLQSVFAGVITRDDVSAIKPAPDIYIKAMETVGSSPDGTWIIEDSVKGVRAGLAAGCKVIAVPNRRYGYLQDYSSAHCVCSTVKAAIEILLGKV